MPCRRIPFAGRRSTRIDVGLALRNDTEFERRADGDIVANANGLLKIIEGSLIEMRFGGDGGHLIAPGTRSDLFAAAALVHPGARHNTSAVQSSGRRRKHHAERRPSRFDQADVNRVVVPAANEFLRPIERIDQEITIAVRGNSAGGHLLFRDDRNTWGRSSQHRENDELGGPVGLGNRRGIALGFCLEATADDRSDRFTRFARRLGEIVEEAGVVSHQRGAIRIPPSSRTAAAFI